MDQHEADANMTDNYNLTLFNNNVTTCTFSFNQTPCDAFTFINNFIIMGLLSLTGIITNSLSMIVLYKDSKSNVTSYLLFILALCDTGFLLVSIFTKQVPVLCSYFKTESLCGYTYYIWPYVTKYGIAITMWFFVMSIWTTCLVTIHRTIAVLIPHKAKKYGTIRSIRKQTIIMLVIALALSFPRFFEFYIKSGKCSKTLHISPLYLDNVYNIAYKNVIVNLFVNIGPLVVLTVLTWYLVREIRGAIAMRRTISQQTDNRRDGGTQLTVVLLLVVIVFIVCQVPHVVYVLARVLLHRSRFACQTPWFYFINISDSLVVLNHAINFFLYCLAGKKFRKQLLEICVSRKKENLYIKGNMYTHNKSHSASTSTYHTMV